MPPAPIPHNEAERLRALLEYDILDSPAETSFDRITRMVSELIEIPIVLISFVDEHRQWFKSRFGFSATESSRDSAFCAHTILSDCPLVVPDARIDERFSDSPLVVGEPYIRFYAGVPLKSASGYNLGTLCAICLEPLVLPKHKIDLLVQFAAIVGNELALRLSLKQLREHQERLLQSQKMAALGQFAARLAHEINTPVHFLAGTTEFLRDGFGSLTALIRAYERFRESIGPAADREEQSRELDRWRAEHDIEYLVEEVPIAIDQARSGISRIIEVIRSLKSFVHPTASLHAPGDVNAAIRSTAIISGSEWRRYSVLDLDLAEDLPWIPCNIGEINQALLNMIVNASHAIEERLSGGYGQSGRIGIQTVREGDEVCVVIEDNGAGIAAESLSKLYDPLFTTKPPGKGTGQGLAIVYDIIVHRHGGRIEVQSAPKVGTTFRIRLPIGGVVTMGPQESMGGTCPET